jgi:hypothetical protein
MLIMERKNQPQTNKAETLHRMPRVAAAVTPADRVPGIWCRFVTLLLLDESTEGSVE